MVSTRHTCKDIRPQHDCGEDKDTNWTHETKILRQGLLTHWLVQILQDTLMI